MLTCKGEVLQVPYSLGSFPFHTSAFGPFPQPWAAQLGGLSAVGLPLLGSQAIKSLAAQLLVALS